MKLNEIIDKYSTPDDFIKAVEEQLLLLAKEQPDFRYNTTGLTVNCRYNAGAVILNFNSDELKPAGPDCKGCIFGQALQNLGWDDARELSTSSTIDFLLPVSVNPHRTLMWRSIQSEQDRGKTWSEAVSLLSANAPAIGESK